MKTMSPDFVAATADLVQLIDARGGRIIRVQLGDRFLGQSNVHLTGKVLWYWPGNFDQYVVHDVAWLYRSDGVHLGYTHHVDLSHGDYFLWGSYEGTPNQQEMLAYAEAVACYDMR